MGHALTIGQVAKTTGVSAKTIRYYEQIGVLPAPSRTSSGYRQYDKLAVERLRFISRARSLGLPLRKLKKLTTALDGGPAATLRPRLRVLVHEQLRRKSESCRVACQSRRSWTTRRPMVWRQRLPPVGAHARPDPGLDHQRRVPWLHVLAHGACRPRRRELRDWGRGGFRRRDSDSSRQRSG